jgi:hypothetical protein
VYLGSIDDPKVPWALVGDHLIFKSFLTRNAAVILDMKCHLATECHLTIAVGLVRPAVKV